PKKPIDPPFEKIGDWYSFKMEVKGSAMTVWIESRKVTTEGLGINPDPWLMLHGRVDCTAGIRNFKLTGTPTVPESVDITAGPDPKGWRGYQGGQLQKRGEEVYMNGYNILKQQVGEGQPPPKRVWTEDAIHYHRPLVEDGTVEYEFYYDPD